MLYSDICSNKSILKIYKSYSLLPDELQRYIESYFDVRNSLKYIIRKYLLNLNPQKYILGGNNYYVDSFAEHHILHNYRGFPFNFHFKYIKPFTDTIIPQQQLTQINKTMMIHVDNTSDYNVTLKNKNNTKKPKKSYKKKRDRFTISNLKLNLDSDNILFNNFVFMGKICSICEDPITNDHLCTECDDSCTKCTKCKYYCKCYHYYDYDYDYY